jgi:hypothetical protein
MSKTPTRSSPPRREPSKRYRELLRQDRISEAARISFGYRIRIGANHEFDQDAADLPPIGSANWINLKRQAYEVGGRNFIAGVFMEELELRARINPSAPPPQRLSDQVSEKTAREAAAAAERRLLGPRLAIPQDLLTGVK